MYILSYYNQKIKFLLLIKQLLLLKRGVRTFLILTISIVLFLLCLANFSYSLTILIVEANQKLKPPFEEFKVFSNCQYTPFNISKLYSFKICYLYLFKRDNYITIILIIMPRYMYKTYLLTLFSLF